MRYMHEKSFSFKSLKSLAAMDSTPSHPYYLLWLLIITPTSVALAYSQIIPRSSNTFPAMSHSLIVRSLKIIFFVYDCPSILFQLLRAVENIG